MTEQDRKKFEEYWQNQNLLGYPLTKMMSKNIWNAALATRPDVFSEDKFKDATKTLGKHDEFSCWSLDEGELRSFVAKCVAPAPDVNQELLTLKLRVKRQADIMAGWITDKVSREIDMDKIQAWVDNLREISIGATDCPSIGEQFLDLAKENNLLLGSNEELVEAFADLFALCDEYGCNANSVDKARKSRAKQTLAKHKAGEISHNSRKDYSELVYLLKNAVRTFDTVEMLDAAADAIEELSGEIAEFTEDELQDIVARAEGTIPSKYDGKNGNVLVRIETAITALKAAGALRLRRG